MLEYVLVHFKAFEKLSGKTRRQYKLKIKGLEMSWGKGIKGIKVSKYTIKDKLY